MRYTITIIGFLVASLLAGCEKEHEDYEDDGCGTSLKGTWRWDKTQGGIGNHLLETPASTGKNISLELKENRNYSFYLNGVVSSSGTYEVVSKQCIHDQTQKSFIDFSGSGDADVMVESRSGQQIQFSDEAYDGTIMYFTRL